MPIDYPRLIRNIVEPRLACHGFRYEEPSSLQPAEVGCTFVRDYWCKRQYISIGRVEYGPEDLAELTNDDADLPTEITPESIGREPDDRLWLSNRYLIAVIDGAYIIRGESLFGRTFEAPTEFRPFDPKRARKAFRKFWWEFRNEEELRMALNEIVEDILREGLDYLEEKVSDIRRFHEKLDARRIAEKERRSPQCIIVHKSQLVSNRLLPNNQALRMPGLLSSIAK